MPLNADILKVTLERAKTENGGVTALGMRFYQRLFEKYPAVKPLFNTPPEEQHKKLMASIGAIVAGVANPESLMPYLRAMGIRHTSYGTQEGHYAAVGENLLSVLQEHLSVEGEWTPEMQTAWAEALTVVAEVMIDAANNPSKYQHELLEAGYLPNGFRVNSDAPWEVVTNR